VSTQLRPIVVIGVGNVLLSDDAIGVRVVEGLRRLQECDRSALPEGTRLVDGGSLLLDLLHEVRDGRGLVLVDAVHFDGPEGTVSVRHDDAIRATGGARGQAPNSVDELLAVAGLMGWLPDRIALVGIEVTQTGFGADLSPVIAAALPRAIEAVGEELRSMDEQTASREHAVATPTQPTGAKA
jgi:hydrogenase maturation protease